MEDTKVPLEGLQNWIPLELGQHLNAIIGIL
jgi:hypothetical protein